MTEAQKLQPCPGEEDFKSFIENGWYYVDKTPYIMEIFDFNSRVLIIRPDGFGKTLMMSALRYFLETDYEHPGDTSKQRELFKGLKILEDQDFCEKHMGQHPVVFFAPGHAGEDSFDQAYKGLCEDISSLYGEFSWLLHSDRLDEDDKRDFRRAADPDYLLSGGALGKEHACESLHDLCRLLRKHCQKKAVLIIDGLDDLLQQAAERGYFEEMSEIVSPMLSRSSFYTSDYMCREIISGRLRPAGGDLFGSVLDHFAPNTTLCSDDGLSEAFGFTYGEVSDLLACFGLDEFSGKVLEFCGGYLVGSKRICRPKDVICCVRGLLKSREPGAAAFDPSSCLEERDCTVIARFLPEMWCDDAKHLQELLDGGTAKLRVAEYLSHGVFEPSKFWGLLFYRGFLTLAKRCPNYEYEFRIPNAGVRRCFAEAVRKHSGSVEFRTCAAKAAGALLSGDVCAANAELARLLCGFVSAKESAFGDGFYRDFINSLFAAAASEVCDYRFSPDGAGGRTVFKSKDRRTAVLLEVLTAEDLHTLERDTDLAANQLDGKDCAAALKGEKTEKILACCAGFCGRECAVSFKEIRL